MALTLWILGSLLGIVMAMLLLAQREEILYLRGALTEKRDHEQRVERADAGLPEIKVDPPKSDVPPPGVAAAIEDVLSFWDSPATQEQKRADIQAWRADGLGWDWILNELQSEVLE